MSDYILYTDELSHFGVLGMKWGIRRYQNPNGTLTPAGKEHRAKYIARERAKISKQYDYYDKKYAKKSARAAKRGDKATSMQYEKMRKENSIDRDRATKDLDNISFEQIRQNEREKLAKAARAASIATTIGVGIAASPVGGMLAGYASKGISDLMTSANISVGKNVTESVIKENRLNEIRVNEIRTNENRITENRITENRITENRIFGKKSGPVTYDEPAGPPTLSNYLNTRVPTAGEGVIARTWYPDRGYNDIVGPTLDYGNKKQYPARDVYDILGGKLPDKVRDENGKIISGEEYLRRLRSGQG